MRGSASSRPRRRWGFRHGRCGASGHSPGPGSTAGSSGRSRRETAMPTDWGKAKEILADAVEMPPQQRAVFLDRACAADSALRRQVDDLLRAHEIGRASCRERGEIWIVAVAMK